MEGHEGCPDNLSYAGNGCAICGDTEARLVVDHNHVTGAIRGQLCHGCNCGLGFLKDDPWLCEVAAAYLRGAAHLPSPPPPPARPPPLPKLARVFTPTAKLRSHIYKEGPLVAKLPPVPDPVVVPDCPHGRAHGIPCPSCLGVEGVWG